MIRISKLWKEIRTQQHLQLRRQFSFHFKNARKILKSLFLSTKICFAVSEISWQQVKTGLQRLFNSIYKSTTELFLLISNRIFTGSIKFDCNQRMQKKPPVDSELQRLSIKNGKWSFFILFEAYRKTIQQHHVLWMIAKLSLMNQNQFSLNRFIC